MASTSRGERSSSSWTFEMHLAACRVSWITRGRRPALPRNRTHAAINLAGCWLWGSVCAIGASALYNTSIALQALEAREVRHEHSLRPSLIGRLVRNRRWLGATLLGLLGWPLEIVALLLAPLTVVQPCLASGLILLLWLGVDEAGGDARRREYGRRRGDRRRRRRGRLGRAGADHRPRRHGARSRSRWPWSRSRWSLPTRCAAAARAAGMLAVVSAGCGYAWTAIASKLLTDELSAGAAARRGGLARHRRRLRGRRAAQRDERPADAARRPTWRR